MVSNIEEIRITEVEQVFDLLRLSNTNVWGDSYPSNWLFRGHSNSSWELVPKAWRDVEISRVGTLKSSIINELSDWSQKIQLSSNKTYLDDQQALSLHSQSIFELKLVSDFYYYARDSALIPNFQWDEISNWLLMSSSNWFFSFPDREKHSLELIALAQHHGVPTRMLDWTHDPLKALLFAVSADLDDTDIAVWAINRKNILELNKQTLRQIPHPEHHIEFCFFDPNRTSNAFSNAQDGVLTYLDDMEYYFSKSGKLPSFEFVLSEYTKIYSRNCEFLKKIHITLDKVRKKKLLKLLYRDRRTKSHLMPNLNECAISSIISLKYDLKDEFCF